VRPGRAGPTRFPSTRAASAQRASREGGAVAAPTATRGRPHEPAARSGGPQVPETREGGRRATLREAGGSPAVSAQRNGRPRPPRRLCSSPPGSWATRCPVRVTRGTLPEKPGLVPSRALGRGTSIGAHGHTEPTTKPATEPGEQASPRHHPCTRPVSFRKPSTGADDGRFWPSSWPSRTPYRTTSGLVRGSAASVASSRFRWAFTSSCGRAPIHWASETSA
jgi:hypothetical protein